MEHQVAASLNTVLDIHPGFVEAVVTMLHEAF